VASPSRPTAPPASLAKIDALARRFPLAGVIGLKSLAEGETSALSFELQNICAQALGCDANRRESARLNSPANLAYG
jgi:hypothetical protein